jgi:hypothetical protein
MDNTDNSGSDNTTKPGSSKGDSSRRTDSRLETREKPKSEDNPWN